MNQQRQEMLSALFDGQTSEFETRRLLADLNQEDFEQLRQYQLIQDAYHKRMSAIHQRIDVCQAVSDAIAEEKALQQKSHRFGRSAKPLLGFTAAAAFAFVAVLGAQQWRYTHNSNNGFVADGNVSASQIPLISSSGLTTASGVSVPFTPESQTAQQKEQQAAKQKQPAQSMQWLQQENINR